jgi:hypothetical protein
MKETPDKNLESLIETITIVKLPYWAKTTMALSITIEPLVKALSPVIVIAIVLSFLAKLLGL